MLASPNSTAPTARFMAGDRAFQHLHGDPIADRLAPPDFSFVPTAERLVIVLRRLVRDMDSVITLDDFAKEPETADLTLTEITAHIGQAKGMFEAERMAADIARRREMRLSVAQQIVLGLLPDAGMVHAALRKAGFSIEEEAELWPELIARAADQWDHNLGPAQKATA